MRACVFLLFLWPTSAVSQVLFHLRGDSMRTYRYDWGDEFTGDSVNTRKWMYVGSMRTIYTNKEQQYYTDGKNHVLREGSLLLQARRDTLEARTVDAWSDTTSLFVNDKYYSCNKRMFYWTSGQLISRPTFGQGYFECRFRMYGDGGFWPAFWLYSGGPNEEIDIMEGKSERRKSIHVDTHCPNKCDLVQLLLKKRSFGGWVKTRNDFSKFSVVSCAWTGDQIRFYLNGICIGVSEVTFENPKLLILNLAVPSNKGPFKPGPRRRSQSVGTFEIDYVRVWNASAQDSGAVLQNVPIEKAKSPSEVLNARPRWIYGAKSAHPERDFFLQLSNTADSTVITRAGVLPLSVAPVVEIWNEPRTHVLRKEVIASRHSVPRQQLPAGEYHVKVILGARSYQSRFTVQ